MPRGRSCGRYGTTAKCAGEGTWYNLSEVLAQEPVGFTLIGESTWAIHYSFHRLGTLDDRTFTITSARQWHHPEDPQAM